VKRKPTFILTACLLMVSASALAQTIQASGKIASNTVGTSATLYSATNPHATLTELTVATPGLLTSCSTPPQITFNVGGSLVNTTTLGNGSSLWSTPGIGLPYPIGPTNVVTAILTQPGIGCLNELPITVTATIELGRECFQCGK
jgi:hypothetical protein